MPEPAHLANMFVRKHVKSVSNVFYNTSAFWNGSICGWTPSRTKVILFFILMTQPYFRFSSGLLAKQCIYCTLSQKPGSMHFLVFVRKPAIGRRKIQTAFERGIFSQNAALKSRNYPRRIPSAKERSNGRTQLGKSCSARGRKPVLRPPPEDRLSYNRELLLLLKQ